MELNLGIVLFFSFINICIYACACVGVPLFVVIQSEHVAVVHLIVLWKNPQLPKTHLQTLQRMVCLTLRDYRMLENIRTVNKNSFLRDLETSMARDGWKRFCEYNTYCSVKVFVMVRLGQQSISFLGGIDPIQKENHLFVVCIKDSYDSNELQG